MLFLIHIPHKSLWQYIWVVFLQTEEGSLFSTESSLLLFQFYYVLCDMTDCIWYSRCRSIIYPAAYFSVLFSVYFFLFFFLFCLSLFFFLFWNLSKCSANVLIDLFVIILRCLSRFVVNLSESIIVSVKLGLFCSYVWFYNFWFWNFPTFLWPSPSVSQCSSTVSHSHPYLYCPH